MPQESSSPLPQQQTSNRGRWIPWIFVAGFGVVLAANATMVYIATSTWTGIAVNRSYDKGLHYNRNLDAANRMASLGWEAAIETELTAARAGTVRVALTDDGGDPLYRADVVVEFERPTHEGYDFVVPLEPTGSGRYSAAFAAPLAGLWDMRLIVTRGDDLFVTTERVLLQ
jgi:nitrogen fixation protein FixH